MTPTRSSSPTSAPRRRSEAPAPVPIARGAQIGGFVVRRVLRTDPGAWTVADAVEAGQPDSAATLWVSAPGAAADRPMRDLFDRLGAVRALCETSDLPLVAPLASGMDGTRLFLARPRLRGITLAERLREGPLPAGETARLASGVARALDALHAFGIPHAPLTPQRILLTPERRPGIRLYDYGVPRAPARACADAALLSAADHLAPEVARGGASTVAADVYALACVLVECLTGQPPFPYHRPLRVLHAHAVERPRPVAASAGLPPEVDHLLAKALHKVPERRPRTAASLARALRRALEGEAPPAVAATSAAVVAAAPAAETSSGGATRAAAAAARDPSPGREDVRPPRRGRVPMGAGVALTLLVTAAAGFSAATLRSGDAADGGARQAAGAPATRPGGLGHPPATAGSAVSARELGQVVRRLEARRARERRALATARSAMAQARAAEALAATYSAARDDALALVPAGATGVGVSLSRAQGAYHQLAAAARRGDAEAYQSAVADVLAREHEAAAALGGKRG
jgi:hypothetical protein